MFKIAVAAPLANLPGLLARIDAETDAPQAVRDLVKQRVEEVAASHTKATDAISAGEEALATPDQHIVLVVDADFDSEQRHSGQWDYLRLQVRALPYIDTPLPATEGSYEAV